MATQVSASAPLDIRPPTIPTAVQPPLQTQFLQTQPRQPVQENPRPSYGTLQRQLARTERQLAIEREWRQWVVQALGPEQAARFQVDEQAFERFLQAVQRDERGLCLLCFTNRKEVVFLPCAHMLVCNECGPRCVRMLQDYRCPAPGCNQVINWVLVVRDVPVLGDDQVAF